MKKFNWMSEASRTFLSRGYLKDGQTAEERVKFIFDNAESILKSMAKEEKTRFDGYSDRMYEYFSKKWISFSSPVWANFGVRGLPISCFGSSSDDNMESILYTTAELGMMSKQGGGTAWYLGNLRERGAPISTGGFSDGAVHFARLAETVGDVCKQSDVRRGKVALYLDIEHPDIDEFLEIKSEGHPIQSCPFGVVISDEFMEDMIAGDKEKRRVWAKTLEARLNNGMPYLIFKGNVNKNKPQVYQDKGLSINHSQMCTEIFLHTDNEKSFVCCLSSLNLEFFDDWKDGSLIEDMTYFLDAVMEEFIVKSKDIPFMERANLFAREERALGLGVLGWHSLLQSKMIPLESIQARSLNKIIFKLLKEKSDKASKEMADLFGEPRLLKGYGRRNSTCLAVAPTKSSSAILGDVSMGIEPFLSNYFMRDLAKDDVVVKNKYLVRVLEDAGKNSPDIWESIRKKDGSVQHLEFLTQEQRDVFKTAMEISQGELVAQNADRQKFVDQGISFNVFVHPSTSVKEINKLYINCWKSGLKSVYYQYSKNSAQEFSRSINDCVACE